MTRRVRWGVIGAGGIARRRTIPEGILPAANAQLQAACSTGGAEYGAKACRNVDELLAESCDAVYVATPVHLHEQHVTAAARAGKHVLCEKPLARDVEEAQRIVETCRKAGVKLGVGLMMRFHAQHVTAQRLIHSGAIGKPVFGRAQLSCWYPPITGAWRQDPARGGGGCLMDLAPHTIDLLEMFLGRVASVSCATARAVHDYPVEDTAVVALQFADGATGMVDSLFNVPDAAVRNRLELYGSRGSILADGTIGQGDRGTMQVYSEGDADPYDAQQRRSQASVRPIDPAPVNVYRAQIEAFSQAVLDDVPPPLDGEHGLWNQRVLAACYESARVGCRVRV